LVLGNWRIRGNEGGAMFLERFDNDGAVISDGWVNVAKFVNNTENKIRGLDIANLGVSGTTTLGTLQMLGDIMADTIRARSGNQVTIADTVNVTGDVTALNATVATLTATSELSADTIRGRVAEQVTVDDNLSVTGTLEAQGDLSVIGQMAVLGLASAHSMYCATDLSIHGNISGWSSFWAAGVVDGRTLATVSSIGRYGFSVTRPSGFPAGVYRIVFNTAAPNASYVVMLTLMGTGNIKRWDATAYAGPPTAERFHVVTYNTTWALVDYVFHFHVYA
jgi:hypothetical protein